MPSKYENVALKSTVQTDSRPFARTHSTLPTPAHSFTYTQSYMHTYTRTHTHILNIHSHIHFHTQVRLVIEFVSNGELYDYISTRGRLSEAEARFVFGEVVDAILYLHDAGYCHRDLKPENILLDSKGHIRLVDFGMAAQYSAAHPLLTTHCGSPHYAAPELIRGLPYAPEAAEVWALGVLLFAMVTGTLPFIDPNMAALYQLILIGTYTIPPEANVRGWFTSHFNCSLAWVLFV
jgi:serine/threonine protein kinase